MTHPTWCTRCTPWLTDLDGSRSRMHMGMVGSWRIAATETDVGHGEPIIDCTAEYVEASGVAELLSELGEVQRAIAE